MTFDVMGIVINDVINKILSIYLFKRAGMPGVPRKNSQTGLRCDYEFLSDFELNDSEEEAKDQFYDQLGLPKS
jgi:hypothetical protein